jgi:histidinol-phosphatase
MTLPTPRELLEFAEEIAREAGRITLEYFGPRVAHLEKGDGSPVTLADRAAEEALRARILERYPRHGVLGEEFGETEGEEPVRWILDPIDGTRSFMRGVPLYAVLVGVEVEGDPVVGVAHFPALPETVSAARGEGCRWNGAPCSVSDQVDLGQALVLTTDPGMTRESPVGPGWDRLSRSVGYTRSWGDAWGHALVATGRAEVMVDPVLSSWDSAPLLTILTEAGGRFTDLSGRATIHGGSGLSTNGRLHASVLELLSSGS